MKKEDIETAKEDAEELRTAACIDCESSEYPGCDGCPVLKASLGLRRFLECLMEESK